MLAADQYLRAASCTLAHFPVIFIVSCVLGVPRSRVIHPTPWADPAPCMDDRHPQVNAARQDRRHRSSQGGTLLCVAAEEGQTEVAEMLIGCGADPTAAMADGRTPLWLAAEQGHAQVCHHCPWLFANTEPFFLPQVTDDDGRLTACLIAVNCVGEKKGGGEGLSLLIPGLCTLPKK